MNCTNCGNEIKENYNFCGNCGEKINKMTSALTQLDEKKDNTNLAKKGTRVKTLMEIAFILYFIELFFGIVMTIAIFKIV